MNADTAYLDPHIEEFQYYYFRFFVYYDCLLNSSVRFINSYAQCSRMTRAPMKYNSYIILYGRPGDNIIIVICTTWDGIELARIAMKHKSETRNREG